MWATCCNQSHENEWCRHILPAKNPTLLCIVSNKTFKLRSCLPNNSSAVECGGFTGLYARGWGRPWSSSRKSKIRRRVVPSYEVAFRKYSANKFFLDHLYHRTTNKQWLINFNHIKTSRYTSPRISKKSKLSVFCHIKLERKAVLKLAD